jgi:ubiquinone/menaquinone biosynthesis C-methylase UbiE
MRQALEALQIIAGSARSSTVVGPSTAEQGAVDDFMARGNRFPDIIKSIEVSIPSGERLRFNNEIIHLKQLSDHSYRLSYNLSVVRIVESMISKVGTISKIAPVVLDFGCWSGTTSRYIHEVLGVGCVGAEIDQSCLEFARRFVAGPAVSFIEVDLERIHCADASFDIVLANAVFANMHPAQHLRMVVELARVTKPGGALIIIDSNNPDSPEVQKRLRAMYAELEADNGSLLTKRMDYIDTLRPETAPNLEAARSTCYATKEEIADYLSGARPASLFDPTSLVPPTALNAPRWSPSTATDHKEYQQILELAGFTVEAGPGWPSTTDVGDAACFVLVGYKGGV